MKRDKVTVSYILQKKQAGKKITMLTAYDYFTGKVVDKAGIDAVLVGDSLAMVVLGYDSTALVTMNDMIHHAKAVNRGNETALLIGDMPHKSFETPDKAVKNAKRFMEEAGCDAVKLEGETYEAASAIIREGIPVLAHLGLTPQTASHFKVQGKDAVNAKLILDASLKFEKIGCFGIVLECVPAKLAAIISARLTIPTIGIGAGPDCDGQVLVLNDLLGLYDKFTPKFVKKYADMGNVAKDAILNFKAEVESGNFPAEEHSFKIKKAELEKLKSVL